MRTIEWPSRRLAEGISRVRDSLVAQIVDRRAVGDLADMRFRIPDMISEAIAMLGDPGNDTSGQHEARISAARLGGKQAARKIVGMSSRPIDALSSGSIRNSPSFNGGKMRFVEDTPHTMSRGVDRAKLRLEVKHAISTALRQV